MNIENELNNLKGQLQVKAAILELMMKEQQINDAKQINSGLFGFFKNTWLWWFRLFIRIFVPVFLLMFCSVGFYYMMKLITVFIPKTRNLA